jgi:CheY-like chemotaxis protein
MDVAIMSDTLLNPRDTKSTIVLAADDAEENLALLRVAVESAGYTFVGAKTGLECLRLISRMKPKLILLDVQMPNLDGFETCRRIRRLPQAGGIPVAFLTARNTVEDVKTGMAAGGNDFIMKPYEMAKLVERIKYWISHSPLSG